MRRLSTLTEFHLRSMWNWRSLYYGRLAEPIIYFGLLTAGLSGVTGPIIQDGQAVTYVRFVFPGMLALVCLRAGAAAMVDVANDRKWGVYALSRLGGARRVTYILSISLSSSLIALFQVVLLYLLLLLLPGGQPQLSDLLVLPAFVLVLIAWQALGIAAGMLVNSYHHRDILLSLGLLPIAFTAPLFYTLEGAPQYLQWLGAANPLTYHVGLMRAALTGGVDPFHAIPSAIILIVCLLLVGIFTRHAQLLSEEVG